MPEKTIESLSARVDTLESHVAETKLIGKDLQEKVNTCVLGCGLESYKKEMKQRCERLDERITNNKDNEVRDKIELENLIKTTSEGCCKKIADNKNLIWRTISTLVVLGICLVGVLGTIQVQSVSVSEYNNHLRENENYRNEAGARFDKILVTYEADRDKRDAKIDIMLNRQLDFNDRILQQNALLERQLEVIKTKVDFSAKKK